jgi:hypothetical protein
MSQESPEDTSAPVISVTITSLIKPDTKASNGQWDESTETLKLDILRNQTIQVTRDDNVTGVLQGEPASAIAAAVFQLLQVGLNAAKLGR